MKFQNVLNAVRTCAAFERLSPAQRGHMLFLASARELGEGELLFQKGDKQTDEFALIVEGALDVLSENGSAAVFTREAGDLMGEIGKVNPHGERTRTVRASNATSILVWKFTEIENAAPEIAEELSRKFEDIAFERLAQDYE